MTLLSFLSGNILAILAAAFGSFLWGGIFFDLRVVGKIWSQYALPKDYKPNMKPYHLLVAASCCLFSAMFMAVMLVKFNVSGIEGSIRAALVTASFLTMTELLHKIFGVKHVMAFAIEKFYDFTWLALQCIIMVNIIGLQGSL